MLKHLSRFVLQWLPTIGAIAIGGFLIGGYWINAALHPMSRAKPLFDQSITDDSNATVATPQIVRDAPRAEPAESSQAAATPEPAAPTPAASEARPTASALPAAKAPDQPPRKPSAGAHKPRLAVAKRDPAPLALAPAPPIRVEPVPAAAPVQAAPAPAAVATSVDRPPADLSPPPKPQEPARVFGLPVPLDPAPLWRTGEKVIDGVVATAKSVIPDFSR
jgi:hypothetical protein